MSPEECCYCFKFSIYAEYLYPLDASSDTQDTVVMWTPTQ